MQHTACAERAAAKWGKPAIPPEFKKAKNPTVISDGRKRRRRSAKFDDLPFFDFEYDYEDNQAADLTGKPNSVPWQISLRYKQDKMAFCGGSIIAPNRVV